MTQPQDRDDLRARYERAADAPVVTGDHVQNQQVIGFALIREPATDQMLVEGEQDLGKPPNRPVPCRNESAGISRTGPSPVHDLPAALLHQGDHLGGSFERALIALGPGGQFIGSLLEKIADMRHHAWFVGGAVRDYLASGPDARVSDLDMTGTIGPGCLSRIATAAMRKSGAGDYEVSISPQLVWSIRPDKQTPRLLEYKPLARTWFRFPAWGGSLAEDAATRDLTINALYYDLRHGVLADPCGQGRADLLGAPRVARTPYRGDDPVEQACIILRCVKFKLRWPELDTTAVADWVKLLPEDLAARIPGTDWDQRIVTTRKRCIPSRHTGNDELAIATELGPPAVRLIVQLQARA